jgi:hypothetical protein
LRLVAKRQRRLLWVILALLVLQFAPFMVMRSGQIGSVATASLAILSLVILIVALIYFVRLLAALQEPTVGIAFLVVLMCAPCINIMVVLLVNSMATRALRSVGLKVGFLGVKDEDVVRMLSPDLCRQCAYDLTGNISGRCPECGALIPRAVAVA